MNDYLADIENALIAKAAAATRIDPNTQSPRAFFNQCGPFPGQKGDEFLELCRQSAPSCFFRLDRAINDMKPFVSALPSGLAVSQGATQNRELLIWSVFIAAKSLRNITEQTLGGPGVVSAYAIMGLLIGQPSSPPATLGQLRGYQPFTYTDPIFYVGRELLGQSTAAVVYELQFGTRVQL